MGITFYWIHDQSHRRQRTAALVDRAPSLIVRLIALSRLPGVGDLRRQIRELLQLISASDPPEPESGASDNIL